MIARRFALAASFLACLAASARASQIGYVVKVDGGKVFLDLGLSSGAAAGRGFIVFSEGEMLKHPVTGAALGPIEQTVASGQVTEAHDNYSVGEILSSSATLRVGMKIRMDAPPPPAMEPAPPPRAAQAAVGSGPAPYYRSPGLAIEAVDVALGDVNGDGSQEILVADKNNVWAYPFKTEGTSWTAICLFTDDANGSQILSLDAADLDGDKKDEVLVTVNNRFFNRVESYILACKDGKFSRTASLPWLLRSFSQPDGSNRVAAQQLIDDGSFPFSNIYTLQYADGKYGVSKERLSYKRLEWIYGFDLTSRDGVTVPIFYTRSNRIRIQFPKDSWSSEETYGQTSNRVRWREKTLQFHPHMVLEQGPEGLAGLYTLKNIPRFGTLSESFGLYNRSELHYLRWNGLSLEPGWSVELGGYAPGLASRGGKDGKPLELLAAVVGSSGRTSIWFFRPPSGAAQSSK